MDKWPFTIESYSRNAIDRAVNDAAWQQFRKSLKGLPTTVKLDKLYTHLFDELSDDTVVRVDNYLNALKRGGQLTLDGTVQR